MSDDSANKNAAGFFSESLTAELQSIFEDEYGRKESYVDTQQRGLKIAQFVLMKEARKHAVYKARAHQKWWV